MTPAIRIVRAAVVPATIPLDRPVTLAGRTHTRREIVLLRLTASDGTTAWGEAAPLPGFSRETAIDALAALEASLPELEDAPFDPDAPFASLPNVPVPSARFAVETAALFLAARLRGIGAQRVLSDDARARQSVNALVLADQPAESAARLAAEGFAAVKMKVGGDPAEDARRVRLASAALKGRAALRLDANRAWSPEQALAFADGIGGVAIAYIEEPVRNPADLPAVAARLPVALDESLVGLADPDAALAARPWARAVILKPTLLGGLTAATSWSRAARRVGVAAVVSACFESDVGLRSLAALAASLGDGDVPAGLDTVSYLGLHTTTPPFEVRGGRVTDPGSTAFEVTWP